MLQTVSRSAITLQSWNAAGDEVLLRTQFSSSVFLAHSQKGCINIKISIVAAVRAWPNPVTAHKLCYLSPNLAQGEAARGLSQSLVEEALQWSHSQEHREDKRGRKKGKKLSSLENRVESLQNERESKDQTNFSQTEGKQKAKISLEICGWLSWGNAMCAESRGCLAGSNQNCLCVRGLDPCYVWNQTLFAAFACRNGVVQEDCEPAKLAVFAKNSSKCYLTST